MRGLSLDDLDYSSSNIESAIYSQDNEDRGEYDDDGADDDLIDSSDMDFSESAVVEIGYVEPRSVHVGKSTTKHHKESAKDDHRANFSEGTVAYNQIVSSDNEEIEVIWGEFQDDTTVSNDLAIVNDNSLKESKQVVKDPTIEDFLHLRKPLKHTQKRSNSTFFDIC